MFALHTSCNYAYWTGKMTFFKTITLQFNNKNITYWELIRILIVNTSHCSFLVKYGLLLYPESKQWLQYQTLVVYIAKKI
jgi:hypothetical protein